MTAPNYEPTPIERTTMIVTLHLERAEYIAAKAAIDRLERDLVEERPLTGAELLACSVAELGLPVRTVAALEGRGIFSVEDLLNKTQEEILGIPNVGPKVFSEIMSVLEKSGIRNS